MFVAPILRRSRASRLRTNVRFSSLLILLTLLAACGGAPAPASTDTSTQPTGAATGAATGATADTANTGSATTAQPAAAGELADSQELRLGVSRNLVNGEKDWIYVHTNLQVWEPLIRYDNELKPQPGLAKSWTLSPDGLTWTFELRDDVRFSNGDKFTADDAIATIEHFRKVSGQPSIFLGGINFPEIYGDPKEEKISDTSFKLVYTEPRPLLPFSIANHYSAMFSAKDFNADGSFVGIPIGTGPFILTDWKRDQYAELIRNENYWSTKPKLTKIHVKIYPDANSRLSALKAGEVDALAELGAVLAAQARDLRNDPNFVVSAHNAACSTQIAFNGTKAPFNDVRLRQAVSLAVDRNAFVKDLLYGYGVPAKSILISPDTTFLSTDADAQLRYDLPKAQELAKAALNGGTANVTLVFQPPAEGITAWPYPLIAAYLQNTLRPLGLNIELKQLESAALTDARNQGDFDLALSNDCWSSGDPNYILGRIMGSKAAKNVAQHGGYSNPEVDAILAKAKVTLDAAEQTKLYKQLQVIGAAEVPISPLFDQQTIIAAHPYVKGLDQRIAYAPTLETVYLEKH